MENITKEQKDAVVNYAITQIVHIAKHGCSGIKCNKCALNRLCKDRRPANSISLAQQVIAYAKTLPD